MVLIPAVSLVPDTLQRLRVYGARKAMERFASAMGILALAVVKFEFHQLEGLV